MAVLLPRPKAPLRIDPPTDEELAGLAAENVGEDTAGPTPAQVDQQSIDEFGNLDQAIADHGPTPTPYSLGEFEGLDEAIGANAIDDQLNADRLNDVDQSEIDFDPSSSRLQNAGLEFGGELSGIGLDNAPTTVEFIDSSSEYQKPDIPDWRVQVSLANASPYFYNSSHAGILRPLKESGGVVFPYLPTVNVNYTARYTEQKLTHSNYNSYFYDGSEVQAITITGEFTVQNLSEGQYLMAAIYFFRAATKMWFGGEGSHVGTPPPLVFLDGYGSHYFPHVPCVLTQFQHTMPPDCDYVFIPHRESYNGAPIGLGNQGGLGTRMPTTSSISITLQPVYSRESIATRFNLDKFAAGELLQADGKGGFI